MLARVASALIICSGFLLACDCTEMPVKQAKMAAVIVFRGTITSFREAGTGERRAIFRVDRVWKGQLAQQFEMPAAEGDWCYAFLPNQLAVGNELLVYGQKIPGGSDPDYFPLPCNTVLVANASKIGKLGRGRKPRSK